MSSLIVWTTNSQKWGNLRVQNEFTAKFYFNIIQPTEDHFLYYVFGIVSYYLLFFCLPLASFIVQLVLNNF